MRSEEGFNASEGVQLYRRRVLTKFQVNLVIPKALLMVIFQPKVGICKYWGFLIIFLIRGGGNHGIYMIELEINMNLRRKR